MYRVHRQPLNNNSFLGTLFIPESRDLLPGVMILPGSEGGIPEKIAERVASHGFVALALGYFGLEGLPTYLENISLEYFQQALIFLKKVPQVQKKPLILMGYSRGAELALIVGTEFPDLIDGLIAVVPCSYICGGFPYINRPAWVIRHQPLTSFVGGLMNHDKNWTEAEDLLQACKKGNIPFHKNTEEDPYEIVDLFQARPHDPQAEIPVENLISPLLLISGEQDKIWPSALYAKQIMNRLSERNSKIERRSLVYPHAGHGILSPYEGPIFHPVGKFWCKLGGTPEGNEQASQNAWNEIFQFLNRLKNV